MASTKKKNIVDSVMEMMNDAKNFALIQFEQTTHKDLETLRADLKKEDAKLQVIKNTLFEKAVNKLAEKNENFQSLRDSFFPITKKSALLTFKEDYVGALKKFYEEAKDNESFAFKFGIIGEQVYGQDKLMQLAQLPGREQLLAQVIGSMKSPMARTTRAMTFNMQKLVFVLNAKAKQS